MGDEILYMAGVVAVGFAVNFGLRALPFLMFGGRDRAIPRWIDRTSGFISPVIIAGLIVYSYAGSAWRTPWPYLAGAVTVALQLWKRNPLVSIVAGTAVYMLLLNCCGCAAHAAEAPGVRFGAPFGDGMVLQRDKDVSVWGSAAAGDEVAVEFAGACVRTTAGADGKWAVKLPPTGASSEGRAMTVTASSGGRTVASQAVTNVLVGEVWLCSGQSNMELALWNAPRVSQHGNHDFNGLLDAAMADEPLVRFATVPHAWSAEPKPLAAPLAWQAVRPGSAHSLSAIAFHYSLMLHRALRIPVGVIVSNWGGTGIRSWTSARALGFSDLNGYLRADLALPRDNHHAPTVLWNGMIEPLLPLTVRGVLWYQGEHDVPRGMEYLCYMKALWQSFSWGFADRKLPFYFVQISPYDYTGRDNPARHSCDIWEAQARFARENQNAGMVSTVDIADWDNIHPGDKRTVALRLAALALNRTYGRTDVPCESAELETVRTEGDTFKLSFRNAGQWILFGLDPAPFEIAGADGVWHPATAVYRPDEIDLRCDRVKAPKAFRYLWDWYGRGRLQNCNGLPLTPIPPTGELVAMKPSGEYRVAVNGAAVRAIAVPMPENRVLPENRHGYSYAAFEADGEVTVDVTSDVHTLARAEILPASKGVKPTVARANRLSFRMRPGMTLVVEPDGRHHALVVAATAPERNAPQPGARGVIHYGPGYHRAGVISVGSGETLYLAPGAWVEGSIAALGTNVTVCGSGVLSSVPWSWQCAPRPPASAGLPNWSNMATFSGRGIAVRGITLLGSSRWTLVTTKAEDVTIDNVKIIGGRVVNDDGIDICRSRNVVIRNSFIRCQDDCLAPKWWCEDLTVTNCTLWTDSANAVRIGYECDDTAKTGRGFRNLVFRDIDVLHLTLNDWIRPEQYWAEAILCLESSNETVMDGIVFDDWRIHEGRPFDIFLLAKAMPITQGYSFPAVGAIRNVTVSNVRLPDSRGGMCVWLETPDAKHPVEGVRFENVTGCGPVTQLGEVGFSAK